MLVGTMTLHAMNMLSETFPFTSFSLSNDGDLVAAIAHVDRELIVVSLYYHVIQDTYELFVTEFEYKYADTFNNGHVLVHIRNLDLPDHVTDHQSLFDYATYMLAGGQP